MENSSKKEALNEKDKEFCVAAGSIGLGISFVCVVQHFYMFPTFEWQAVVFSVQFIFSSIAFGLLIKKHPAAPLCLIIATVLIFLYFGILIYLFFAGVFIFSFILVLLFIFLVIILVLMYMRGLPAKLRSYRQQKKEELEFWDNKI